MPTIFTSATFAVEIRLWLAWYFSSSSRALIFANLGIQITVRKFIQLNGNLYLKGPLQFIKKPDHKNQVFSPKEKGPNFTIFQINRRRTDKWWLHFKLNLLPDQWWYFFSFEMPNGSCLGHIWSTFQWVAPNWSHAAYVVLHSPTRQK